MRPMPIRYVEDVEAAVRFYQALGLRVEAENRIGNWIEMVGDGGRIALHGGESAVQLTFEATEPLEQVVAGLEAKGYTTSGIYDEAYGRAVDVEDPEGLELTVTEYDRELYT